MTVSPHRQPLAAWLAAWAMLLGTPRSDAADDDAQRAQLEQKIKLTARLLGDSPTALRISASGNPQALTQLDEGRLHHSIAADLLAKGDYPGARKAVDDALHHISAASRLVPDARARQAAAKLRHEQLLASVDRLVEAWRARASGTPAGQGVDLMTASSLVADARQLAQESRYEEANQKLALAERRVLDGVNAMLQTTTLDYTARPATPAEEFQVELARQRGFADLVPLALRDLKPRADAVALIERYNDTSNNLRIQAVSEFQAGELTQALASIRNATQYLQRALLAAGLVAPQPTETPP